MKKKPLFFLVIFFLITFLLGWQLQCSWYSCYFTVPVLLVILAILLALIVPFVVPDWRILKRLLLIFILFIVTGPLTFFIYFGGVFTKPIVFHLLNTYYSTKWLRQPNESVKYGSITQSGSQLIYTCQDCNYSLTFPRDWKYSEKLLNYEDQSRNEFWFTIIDRQSKLEDTSMVDKGLLMTIYVSKGPGVYARGDRGEEIFEVGDIRGKMGKLELNSKNVWPPNTASVSFANKGLNYLIRVQYGNEQIPVIDQRLKEILTGFHFLN